MFHALADPARRRVIALLREAGELPVGAIGNAFAMTQNGVSKHVKVLESAGLVRRRIEGRVHWISVDWGALQIAHQFLDAHRHLWVRDSMRSWTTRGARVEKQSEAVVDDSAQKLLIERLIPAPPRMVFEAWLHPEALRRFMFGVPGSTVSRAECDGRVGGDFLIVMNVGGQDITTTGNTSRSSATRAWPLHGGRRTRAKTARSRCTSPTVQAGRQGSRWSMWVWRTTRLDRTITTAGATSYRSWPGSTVSWRDCANSMRRLM